MQLQNLRREDISTMKKQSKTVKMLISLLGMLAGSFLMAIGVYFFKIPNGFSTGGVSGIATILGKIIPQVTPGLLIFAINALLLVLGFAFIGKETGWKTVFCSFAFSGFTWILEWIVPLTKPLTDQPFLELAYAMLLTGIGSAILFNCDASSGGTDIVALILKKYTSLNVGTALLCTDFFIAASSFFVFGIEVGLFSLLGLFAKAFLVDSVIESMNVCKSFVIITQHPEPIVDYILNVMKHSATSYDAVGEYTGDGRKVIMTICRRPEAARLKLKIKEIDPHAFVTVQSTSEIIGRGFRAR